MDKVTVLLEAFAVLGVVVDKVGIQPRRSGKWRCLQQFVKSTTWSHETLTSRNPGRF